VNYNVNNFNSLKQDESPVLFEKKEEAKTKQRQKTKW